MRTPEEIREMIECIFFHSPKGEDPIKELTTFVIDRQQEAFNDGRDKALEWVSNTIATNSFLYTREAHSLSILLGKQATQLQFKQV